MQEKPFKVPAFNTTGASHATAHCAFAPCQWVGRQGGCAACLFTNSLCPTLLYGSLAIRPVTADQHAALCRAREAILIIDLMHMVGARQDATGQLLSKRKDCKNVSHSCSRLIETVYVAMASGGDRTICQEAVRMLQLTSSRVLQNPHRSWSHLQWRGIQGKA